MGFRGENSAVLTHIYSILIAGRDTVCLVPHGHLRFAKIEITDHGHPNLRRLLSVAASQCAVDVTRGTPDENRLNS